jgi:hypothetical protein
LLRQGNIGATGKDLQGDHRGKINVQNKSPA